jgi:hypothetical protein
MCGQKWVLLGCGSNGVGRWRRVFSGGPVRIVCVTVGRNCRAYQRGSVDDRAWPVACPQRSSVRCGVLPAVA